MNITNFLNTNDFLFIFLMLIMFLMLLYQIIYVEYEINEYKYYNIDDLDNTICVPYVFI